MNTNVSIVRYEQEKTGRQRTNKKFKRKKTNQGVPKVLNIALNNGETGGETSRGKCGRNKKLT